MRAVAVLALPEIQDDDHASCLLEIDKTQMLFFETLYKCEFYTVVLGLAEIMFVFKLAPSAMKAHANIMRRKKNKNYR